MSSVSHSVLLHEILSVSDITVMLWLAAAMVCRLPRLLSF